MIEADGLLNSIIHVSDLYTTLSRFAGADQRIPRDRLVDGVDQSASLLFADEQKSRRDHVIVSSINSPKANVMDQLELSMPAPGPARQALPDQRQLPTLPVEIAFNRQKKNKWGEFQ
jgi:arylsulfatase